MVISYSKNPTIRLFQINNLETQKQLRLFVTSRIKFVIIFVILSRHREHYPNRVNYATFLVNSMSRNGFQHQPLTLVTLTSKILTLSHSLQKSKKRARFGPKLRWSVFLAVEYLYGETNLCKLEVHSIFAILARGVFRTQSNIYDGAFHKNAPSQMLNWVLNTPPLVFIQFLQKWGFNMAVVKLQALTH